MLLESGSRAQGGWANPTPVLTLWEGRLLGIAVPCRHPSGPSGPWLRPRHAALGGTSLLSDWQGRRGADASAQPGVTGLPAPSRGSRSPSVRLDVGCVPHLGLSLTPQCREGRASRMVGRWEGTLYPSCFLWILRSCLPWGP